MQHRLQPPAQSLWRFCGDLTTVRQAPALRPPFCCICKALPSFKIWFKVTSSLNPPWRTSAKSQLLPRTQTASVWFTGALTSVCPVFCTHARCLPSSPRWYRSTTGTLPPAPAVPVEHAACWVQGAGHTAGSPLSRGAEPSQPGHSPTELQDQAVGTGRGTPWPLVQEGIGVKQGEGVTRAGG